MSYSVTPPENRVKYLRDGVIPNVTGLLIPPKNKFPLNSRIHAGLKRWAILVFCCYCGKFHYHDFPAPSDLDQSNGFGSTRVSKCNRRDKLVYKIDRQMTLDEYVFYLKLGGKS